MNIVGRMDLMEALAAEYALGTLRGGARRRLEALAEESGALRELIHAWKVRLGGLSELCTAQKPSVSVWPSIEAERNGSR